MLSTRVAGPAATRLLLVLAALIAAAHAASPCRRSAECADKSQWTIDYCEPTKNICYNFPRSASTPYKGPATFHELWQLRDSSNAAALSPAERLVIVESAAKVMRDVHPHRNMHLTLLGVDPVPKLQALARPLREDIAANRTSAMSTFDFHQRMITIFNSINDLHTTYRAPGILRTAVAILPFTLRHYYEHDNDAVSAPKRPPQRKYVVTDLANDFVFGNPKFRTGVRVVSYDKLDIDTAVLSAGAAGIGANEAARVSRGCRRLTRRFLRRQLMPTAAFASIGFLTADGHTHYVNVPWVAANFPKPPDDPLGDAASVTSNALSASRFERQTAGILPALSKMSWEMKAKKKDVAARPAVAGQPFEPGRRIKLPVDPYVKSHISGEVVMTKYGKLGVIKIFDYNTFFFRKFLRSFLELVMSMQDHAAVIDVRGNNGGIVYLAQMSIQFFTSNMVKPVLFSTRITPITAKLENALPKLNPSTERRSSSFTESIKYGLRAGDQFSGAFSLISEQLFQDYKGGRYKREMYVLTDAETYSSGDVFAASCQDNAAAFLIGTDETTGAGGSSSVFYSAYLNENCPEEFPKLPGGVDFALSHRRMNRVGPYSGIAIENFGVRPNKRYYPTYRDRMYDDADFFEFLGKFTSARYNASLARTPTPTPLKINLFPEPTVKPATVSPKPKPKP